MKWLDQNIKFRLNPSAIFKLLSNFVIFAPTDPAVSWAGSCSTWWPASFPVLQPCSLISPSTCRTPLRTTNTIIKVEEPHDSAHPDMPKISDNKHMNTISESLVVLVILQKRNKCSYSSFLSSDLSYMCLDNLERSLTFGGRRKIPSPAETAAILAS